MNLNVEMYGEFVEFFVTNRNKQLLLFQSHVFRRAKLLGITSLTSIQIVLRVTIH